MRIRVSQSQPDDVRGDEDEPRLSRFLHDGSDLLHEDLDAGILAVDFPIRLSRFACFGHEDSEIGPHARVDHSDVGTDGSDLLEG